MTNKFTPFDLAHAQMRLSGSIIQINKDPVVIKNIERGHSLNSFRLYYQVVGGPNSLSYTSFPSLNVDLMPVSLGLVNWPGGHCISVSRKPSQIYKIGLSSDNFQMRLTTNPEISFRSMSCGQMLKSKQLAKTIKGDFPSYDEVVASVNKNKRSIVAFCRTFALSSHGCLYHKNLGRVGNMEKDQPFALKFQYLEQLLAKELEKAA